MRIEIGRHSLSKKEIFFGTAVFGGPFLLLGVKLAAEKLTQEQIKEQEEREEDQKKVNGNKDNYLSGEASQIFPETTTYVL